MGNSLALVWLGLFVFAATFSASQQAVSCLPGPNVFCLGQSDDTLDLSDPPNIGVKGSVTQMRIRFAQVGNFTNEVLLSFPSLELLSLTDNNISPEFFPIGVFKNVKINELIIVENNIQYNNHFAKVINDLEFLRTLDLSDNPIQNFDSAAIVTFDRITSLTFSPENIVCDCDLSWFRNYLLNYENTFTQLTQIVCGLGQEDIPIGESNFCSASDALNLECRVCNRASNNEECNAMATETCSTTQISVNPVCLNEITYQGGQKQITKSCAGQSRCQSANNAITCYSANPSRCVYCCRGALCNDFETAVLENYFPENYPFRPTTPVPTTTLPTTTDRPTTSTFTTTPVTTTPVTTTLSPSTVMATTFSTTTVKTTIPITSETTKVTTTFPPTTETTTLPTTTIQTTISTTNQQATTQGTTLLTTIQTTTPKVTTMEPSTTTVTTMQPTTTSVTTMEPTTKVTTTKSTTSTKTTMQPTTTPATTMQPTTTRITTMQPTTTTITTRQPTTTKVTTMQPTTTKLTTMQPTTTTITTRQPITTKVTTMQPTTLPATTMQTTSTQVTTMQATTTKVTTMQPTTTTITTMQPTTTKETTTQPATTTVTTNQPTTTATTNQPKTTTNVLTTTQPSTTSSITPRATITTTEYQEEYRTTPDVSDLTTLLNIVKTTTIETTTVTPTTMTYICPQNEQNGRYGELQWPETKVDSVAIIGCPFNYDDSTANATRRCVLRGRSPVWMDPNLSSCLSNSDVLEILAHENVTTENVEEIAEELAELTDESDTLEELDIENAVTVIEGVSKVVNNVNNDTESILDDIIETVSHLSQVEDEQLAEAQRARNTSSRIIQVVENTIMSIEIQGSEYNSKSEALDVTIIRLDNETEAENIRFPKSDPQSEDENEESDDTDDTASETSIQIPKSVVGDARRVQFILYKDTSLFDAIVTADEETTKRPDCADDEPCIIERQALRSFVISASIEDRRVTDLDTPIVNVFTHLTDDDEEFANNSQCVFWDFDAAQGRGDWSTKGCSVNSSEAGVTICHCNHLTNFALLLDIYGNVDEIPENHQRIITYISLGGVALSFFCIVLSLVSYACAPRLRADKRVRVLLSLMVALMLMNMAFLFDSMVSSFAFHSKYLCFGAAVAMHYTLLCVMTWMAVEAFTMYLALVRVFDSKQRHFMLKVSFLGWGLPIVIVGASVGIDRENYGYYNNLCYLNRISFFISFFVPACIVLIWNSTVYVLVSRQMCRLRKRQTEYSQTFSLSDQLRASFSLTFLLGLTWLFGFFSFGELNLAFTYLFALTNALQGFIIFMFHCVFKKEIRKQWQALCCPCVPITKDGDFGTYSRSRSGTNGSNAIRPGVLLSNGREYAPVHISSGRSTRSRSWFWQPDRRRRSVAESTTTDMTRLSGVGSEIGSPTSTVDIRHSQSGLGSNTTSFVMCKYCF